MANFKLLRFSLRPKELSVFSQPTMSQIPWFNSYSIDSPQKQLGLWFILGFWTQFGNSLPEFTFFSPLEQARPFLLSFSSSFSNTNLTLSYEFHSTLINIQHYLAKSLYFDMIRLSTLEKFLTMKCAVEILPFSSYGCISTIYYSVGKTLRYHRYV